jgi:hypothetical protein
LKLRRKRERDFEGEDQVPITPTAVGFNTSQGEFDAVVPPVLISKVDG